MVTIKDIAIAAGTSSSTVSRVLNGMAVRNQELAERIRAIAHEMNYQPNEAGRSLRMGSDDEYGPVFEMRQRQDLHAKRRIASAAANLVTSSDVVALDSGSTVAQLAYFLPQDVLVYTNSLAVLQPAAKRGISVHLAPGLYVSEMAAVFGIETDEYFRRHRSSLYFLSAARADVRTGLFNLSSSTYSVKQAALAHARKKVVLMHHDKFCDAGLDSFAPWSMIDVMVTDYVPDIYREAIFASGVHVIETGQQDSTDTGSL